MIRHWGRRILDENSAHRYGHRCLVRPDGHRFWSRNLIVIALAIPAGIYIIRHKAASKEEKDRREALSTKSLAVSLFIPIIIVFGLTVYVLIKLIPLIIQHWHP